MIHPDEIVIQDRQRSDIGIDDQFVASIKSRLINPIVLRHDYDGGQIILVAGERRLLALKKIGVNPLLENIHYRFFEDLSPTEAYIIELEENLKREDLPWRDKIRAFGKLHETLVAEANGTPHSVEDTGRRANIMRTAAYSWHMLYRNINSPLLASATGIDQAYSILQIYAERKAADVVNNLINIGRDLANAPPPSSGTAIPADVPTPLPSHPADLRPDDQQPLPTHDLPQMEGSQPSDPNSGPEPIPAPTPVPAAFVLNLDFLSWIKSYSGSKFNLIHVDFPYGIDWESFNDSGKARAKADGDYDNSEDLYWTLVKTFCDNIDRFVSYSAHVMFWFPMDYYEETRLKLAGAGLAVNKYPLVWYKSDGLGVMPGAQTRLYPRRLYETAFLCTRGSRTLVRASGNAYGAPHASNPLHPSHKPEAVLRHFFSMLVDETSEVFDPTCGSGSALRVANDLGARRVLGLEIDENFAKTAEHATRQAYNLRKLIG